MVGFCDGCVVLGELDGEVVGVVVLGGVVGDELG